MMVAGAGGAAALAVTAALLTAGTPPATASVASAAVSAGGTGDCDSLATCYSPRDIRVAYGIQPLADRGIDGRGQTVVIPALAEPRLSPPVVSNIRQDLAAFDKLFHLPAANLRVSTDFAPGSRRWLAMGEEVLDTEMVHAIAPAAALRVVLFTGSELSTRKGLITALTDTVRYGSTHGDIISISAGSAEHCFTTAEAVQLHAALAAAAVRHVTVTAGTGDIGPISEPCVVSPPSFTPVRGVTLPASDPLVLATGGTSLTASHKTGAYISETTWDLPYGDVGSTFQATGGGFSRLYARPAYQDGLPGAGPARGVPDVSADASGHTGMALTISLGGGKTMIRNSGGTSATAPFWAGLIALANQYAGHDLGFVNPSLYAIARTACYHAAFHDVTTGTNTVKFPPKTYRGYQAAPGWDPVTGLGSPDAAILVPLLAHGE
ncbi:MAG TPA: S53 family peptidase [Streptosporangiaceae bacterium]|nr:S53 family peptidase [Streptosporangiaceae bacterium]